MNWIPFCKAGEIVASRLDKMKPSRRKTAFALLDQTSLIVRQLAAGRSLEEACEELRIPVSQAQRTLDKLMAEAYPHKFRGGTYFLAPPVPQQGTGGGHRVHCGQKE